MAPRKQTKGPGEPTESVEATLEAGSEDFDLDAFLQTHDLEGGGAADASQAWSARHKDTEPTLFDPDATMSYRASGQDYPELPMADDYSNQHIESRSEAYTERGSERPSRRVAESRSGSRGESSSEGVARDPRPSEARRTGSATSARRTESAPAATSRPRPSRRSVAPAPELQPAAPERSRSRRLAAYAPEPYAASAGADPGAFRQAAMHDTNYRVRGGGIAHKRTPLITIALAIVVIAALFAAGYFLVNFVQAFVAEGPAEEVIMLTPQQTRSAIDGELPKLTDYVNSTADDTFAVFQEAGWNVFLNDRNTSDNPDGSNSGKEIIHLPANVPAEALKGYYESEFNAYDFTELQRDFNGAWSLALTRGDRGGFAQLKYLNLNSEGLDAEMAHLLELQGLSGEGSFVDNSGTDNYGNTFSMGYTTVGETLYYWKVIGCGFDDYYQGRDKRKLPATAVYVKLTVATFDFYGAQTPPPASDGA